MEELGSFATLPEQNPQLLREDLLIGREHLDRNSNLKSQSTYI